MFLVQPHSKQAPGPPRLAIVSARSAKLTSLLQRCHRSIPNERTAAGVQDPVSSMHIPLDKCAMRSWRSFYERLASRSTGARVRPPGGRYESVRPPCTGTVG